MIWNYYDFFVQIQFSHSEWAYSKEWSLFEGMIWTFPRNERHCRAFQTALILIKAILTRFWWKFGYFKEYSRHLIWRKDVFFIPSNENHFSWKSLLKRVHFSASLNQIESVVRYGRLHTKPSFAFLESRRVFASSVSVHESRNYRFSSIWQLLSSEVCQRMDGW